MDKHKHPKRPHDINVRAASTVALATNKVEEVSPEVKLIVEPTKEERHAAAAMLGRKGGQARARRLPATKRSEIAKKAADARWRTNK
ncbi:MAG: RNA-binding protein [Chloroflexi bacterium]|nr:RNA-binding protein [Chloroflexota bacterium]